MSVRAALSVFLVALLTVSAIAGDEEAPPFAGGSPERVTVALLTEHERVRAGTETLVAVRFTLAPRWHVYWRNPGDSGMRPKIEFDLPDGYELGSLQYPTPRRIDVAHLVTFGYEDEVLLSARLRVPPDAEPGEIELAAKVTWLACDEEQCIDGTARVRTTLTVGPQARPRVGEAAAFRRHREALPRALPKRTTATRRADALVLDVAGAGVPVPEAATIDFFPADEAWVTYAPPTLSADRRALSLVPRDPTGDGDLTGLLAITHDGRTTSYDIRVTVVTDGRTDSNGDER